MEEGEHELTTIELGRCDIAKARTRHHLGMALELAKEFGAHHAVSGSIESPLVLALLHSITANYVGLGAERK